MKLFFKKGIGPYRKGMTKNVPDKLATFYVKHGIAEPVYRDDEPEVVEVPQSVKRPAVTKQAGVPEPVAEPEVVDEPEVVEAAVEPEVVEAAAESEVVDEFEGLELEELRALAELRGIKVHHKAGSEKIKEALRSAGTV